MSAAAILATLFGGFVAGTLLWSSTLRWAIAVAQALRDRSAGRGARVALVTLLGAAPSAEVDPDPSRLVAEGRPRSSKVPELVMCVAGLALIRWVLPDLPLALWAFLGFLWCLNVFFTSWLIALFMFPKPWVERPKGPPSR